MGSMNRLDENRGRVMRGEVIIRSVVRISGCGRFTERDEIEIIRGFVAKIAVKFNQVRCSEFQIEFSAFDSTLELV